jgi:hypothetical protein
MGRLEDKVPLVRKNAIHLARLLLEYALLWTLVGTDSAYRYNPYSPALNLQEFHERLEAVKRQLEEYMAKRRAGQLAVEDDAVIADIEKQRHLYVYLEDTIGFIVQLGKAMPTLARLLSSKANTDIIETIRFFVTASAFRLAGANDGVRKMLPLIWSKDQEVKQAVTDAYETLLDLRNAAPVPLAKALIEYLCSLFRSTDAWQADEERDPGRDHQPRGARVATDAEERNSAGDHASALGYFR